LRLVVEGVETVERVERVEHLETLTATQRELLDGAIRSHPELAEESLVVYRLKGGKAIVAPRTEAISIGDPLICTGSWTETLWNETPGTVAEVSIAPAVADATPWLEPPE
jgi:hypothetical protein